MLLRLKPYAAGYVVVSTAMRLSPFPTVDRAVQQFAAARPPGIYKHDYLEELFKYHHERRWRSAISAKKPRARANAFADYSSAAFQAVRTDDASNTIVEG